MTSQQIRSVRTRLGLTQPQIAEVLGVSVGTVSMWETGKRNPTGLHLHSLNRMKAKLDADDRAGRWRAGALLAFSLGTVAVLSYLYDEPPPTP